MSIGSIALALVASVCNALSSVLQRKANIGAAALRRFGVALLVDLLHRPVWLLGAAAMVASFLLQATALGIGSLAAVQPVLVLELPLTLLIGARVLAQPLRHREWISAFAMGAGLAVMIAVLNPQSNAGNQASLPLRMSATVAVAAGVAVLLLCGWIVFPRARAALFGAAAGAGFGLTASLMKLAMTSLIGGGLVGLVSAWETYGTMLAGIGSIVLVQAALNAGTLVAAQPGITLLDPLVSVLWGTLVLHETVRRGPILLLAATGAATIAIGAIALARASEESRRETGEQDQGRHRDGTGQDGTGQGGTARGQPGQGETSHQGLTGDQDQTGDQISSDRT